MSYVRSAGSPPTKGFFNHTQTNRPNDRDNDQTPGATPQASISAPPRRWSRPNH